MSERIERDEADERGEGAEASAAEERTGEAATGVMSDSEADADAGADAVADAEAAESAAGDARRDAILASRSRSADEEPGWRARLSASLAVAAALAGVTLLLTVARMNEVDVTGQSTPQATLGVTVDFYLLPALVMLLVAGVFAWFGAFRHWLTGALAGLLAAIAGSILGYALRVLLGGTVALDGSVWAIIAGQVFGLFFPFLALGTLLGALMPLVWRRTLRADVLDQRELARRAAGYRPLPADGKLALVRIPGDAMEGGERTHVDRTEIDEDLANDQWEAYVAALEEHGWTTVEVPAAPTMPDSVFVEDQLVVLGDVAIIPRSGSAVRRTELPGVRAALEGEDLVEVELEAPATLDGGDVLVVDQTVYVGASSRTNAEGIRQLRRIAGELGYRVVAVPVRGALHLKSVATALPDGTVLAWPDAFDEPTPFDRVIDAPERLGASVLPLDAATVAVSAAAPATAALIRSLGYAVIELDVSEFEKAEGGLTCLSARIV